MRWQNTIQGSLLAGGLALGGYVLYTRRRIADAVPFAQAARVSEYCRPYATSNDWLVYCYVVPTLLPSVQVGRDAFFSPLARRPAFYHHDGARARRHEARTESEAATDSTDDAAAVPSSPTSFLGAFYALQALQHAPFLRVPRIVHAMWRRRQLRALVHSTSLAQLEQARQELPHEAHDETVLQQAMETYCARAAYTAGYERVLLLPDTHEAVLEWSTAGPMIGLALAPPADQPSPSRRVNAYVYYITPRTSATMQGDTLDGLRRWSLRWYTRWLAHSVAHTLPQLQ